MAHTILLEISCRGSYMSVHARPKGTNLQIFHCMFMWIFSDAQEQLTQQSEVGSA